MGIGYWVLGMGNWGLGPIPNPQSPIPNPQINNKIFLMTSKNIILLNYKINNFINYF